MSCNCSSAPRLVKPRCTDVKIQQKVLSDEQDGVLVDDNNTAFSLGIIRVGSYHKSEFQREEQE